MTVIPYLTRSLNTNISPITRGTTAIWVGISTALIIWPFSVGWFSSQMVGACLLFPGLLFASSRSAIWHAVLRPAWIPLCLLFVVMAAYYLQNPSTPGLVLFGLYMAKIPLLYMLSLIALEMLQRVDFSPTMAQRIIWLSVLFPLAIVLGQVLSPTFHAWSVEQLGGFRAAAVLDSNSQGHPFRFLGPNGFLFASHGVAFAFTAIALLILRQRQRCAMQPSAMPQGTGMNAYRGSPRLVTFSMVSVEIFCLLIALLSARSAVPLVALYLLIRLAMAPSWGNRLRVAVTCVLIGAAIVGAARLSTGGKQWLHWLVEPARTSLAKGEFASDSVADTLRTYRGITGSALITRRDAQDGTQVDGICRGNVWLGYGIYYRNDLDYYRQCGIVGSDSGFVRIIYMAGYLGLTLFLLYWSWELISSFTRASRNKQSASGISRFSAYIKPLTDPGTGFLILFFSYGLVFFFKSEWLYQNFFIFCCFSVIHSLNFERRPS